MPDRIRSFLAHRVFHPLQGMPLGDWWSLLRRHRFAVSPGFLPRAAIQTALAASNSINARVERARFGREVEATRVAAPLFILGHYRSGTTHLHNLLALDPRLAAPTLYQTLNPLTFLGTERLAVPIADRLIVRRRFMDGMALSATMPGEDEFALCAMTGLSPYMASCFPEDGSGYDRYLTFRDASAAEVTRWGRALSLFCKKVAYRTGRGLVLKSPPHTARIRLLLGLFPDARFVHIHRHPHAVFRSTRHMIRKAQPLYHLRDVPSQDSDDRILAVYAEMYRSYFGERDAIPAGRLAEIRFDDLERDPVGVVGSVYRTLGLEGFDDLRPRLDEYLGSIAGYRKNRLDDLPGPLRDRIAREWGRSFDEWGYRRDGASSEASPDD